MVDKSLGYKTLLVTQKQILVLYKNQCRDSDLPTIPLCLDQNTGFFNDLINAEAEILQL